MEEEKQILLSKVERYLFPYPRMKLKIVKLYNDIYTPIPKNSLKKIIHSYYIKQEESSNEILIFFHGNGENCIDNIDGMKKFAKQIKMNILLPEYPGYHLFDENKPSEELIYENIPFIYNYVTKILKIEPKNIYVLGRSLGTGIGIYLASKFEIGGLLLISSYTTSKAIFNNYIKDGKLLEEFDKKFRSIDFIDKVKCPVLFIHGKVDDLINFHETEILYEKTNSKKKIILEENMGHNNIDYSKMGTYLINFYKIK